MGGAALVLKSLYFRVKPFILSLEFRVKAGIFRSLQSLVSRQPFPVKIMIDQKQLENVESFKYLGSILTNDGRCTCEIKCRIAMAKAALNKKRTLFTSTLDLKLRKKLVKCYVWSIALYGAEAWTLRAMEQKHLESFEMWCWRRVEKISWTDHMRNEDVLLRVKEQRNILREIRKRKAN